jgi:hypothetical protein
MGVFPTELGIWLSFDKASEFRGGEPLPLGTPLYRAIAPCPKVKVIPVHTMNVSRQSRRTAALTVNLGTRWRSVQPLTLATASGNEPQFVFTGVWVGSNTDGQ